MNAGSVLTWLVTFGMLGWVGAYIYRNARHFADDPLAGPKMRRLTRLWVPILAGGFLLSLVGFALYARLGGRTAEQVLGGGVALTLMWLAVLLALTLAVAVAAQGFTLSERKSRLGDEEAALRMRGRGLVILLLGAAGVLVTLFAILIIANPV